MRSFFVSCIATVGVFLFSSFFLVRKEVVIYLIGDSTVADYSLEEDYMDKRYPVVGWGQMFQPFFVKDSLMQVLNIMGERDSVRVDDRARGGRSTRTFFQEGRWRAVYERLQPGDIVMMQFGHNDGSEKHVERYVNIEGYKEFLRLFAQQAREKGATPIILTPVARNYPWKDGHLQNVHGEYPNAAKEVAEEQGIHFIDLNALSMQFFSQKGKDEVTEKYFMNLPPNTYQAYPDGQKDNTHFQTEGGRAVAQLVFDAMKTLESYKVR
ncbi:MAG TPA: rhamnogalacturonan acetylesterase [Sphingobacterium sp.]|nr:rhamnogalacturonan acetylesterase [Sphingobacterium sp.]